MDKRPLHVIQCIISYSFSEKWKRRPEDDVFEKKKGKKQDLVVNRRMINSVKMALITVAMKELKWVTYWDNRQDKKDNVIQQRNA